ncbi:MAG: putative bifunctional diguanylate cyclase/phosphodiesterase [Inquilinaceae bacterium]
MADVTFQGASEPIAAALRVAGDIVYEWHLDSDRITWIGPVEKVLGEDARTLFATGAALNGRINPEDLPSRLQALSDHRRSDGIFDCEYRVRLAEGQFTWIHDRGGCERDDTGQPVVMRGVLRLINGRKQNEARLERLANYDELTGQFNRNRLREALQQAMTQSERYGVDGAYLTIGIDNLAMINAAYGQSGGDAVITGVGLRLGVVTRASDVIGRVGGDVYGIVLSHCPEDEVASVAGKILDMFRDRPIDTPVGPIPVTVSVGGTTYPAPMRTAVEAMTRAETAMQEAKRAGRNDFCLYEISDEQLQRHRDDIATVEQVKKAIKENRLLFAFQPIVARGDYDVAWYECLLRLRGPDDAIIVAGHFVPAVERMGLNRLMDRHVLEMAVRELEDSPSIALAINISGVTVPDPEWLDLLIRLIGGRAAIARRLMIEITETAAMRNITEAARFVTTVRDLGCRVALDDFGAGYISFCHLRSLPVDVVKIDGSFINGIAESRDNRLFVSTLIGLAKGFGMITVAECVETEEDVAVLAAEGVDYLQGYYFARPAIERSWVNGGASAAIRRPPPVVDLTLIEVEALRRRVAAAATDKPAAIGRAGQ